MAGIIVLEFLDNEEIVRRHRLRLVHRNIRDAANPFEQPTFTFIKLFRLNKEAARFVIEALQPHMEDSARITSVPKYMRILCAIHFFGHGSYQLDVGQAATFLLSQPTVSRCIKEVSEKIIRHLINDWIQFPRNAADINMKVQSFSEKYNFPDCIGAIDGTHISIVSPPKNHPIYPAAPYLNRKGYFSVNCQIICDANCKIINMNARYPGSVHDSAIWMMSNINVHLRDRFINENINWHIIGDEGYPLSPWLMVQYPGRFLENTPEGRFNRTLLQGRNCIELLNGKLKGRFRCLLKDRVLHYDPIRAAKIIYSCGVLHNICMHFNVPMVDNPDLRNIANAIHNLPRVQMNHQFFHQGQNKRNNLTQLYFA